MLRGVALMVCNRCTTRFAVDLHRCPGCTAEDARPDHEEAVVVPKVTVAGGVSHALHDAQAEAADAAVDAPAPDPAPDVPPEPASPTDADVAPAEAAPEAAKPKARRK